MTRSHPSHLSVATRPNQARFFGFLGILLLGVAPFLHAQNDNGDPPNRVARISVIQGNVSLEPNGVDAFSQAEINYPLTSGDRVYAAHPLPLRLQRPARDGRSRHSERSDSR